MFWVVVGVVAAFVLYIMLASKSSSTRSRRHSKSSSGWDFFDGGFDD